MSSIGEAIKRERRAAGLTSAELASRVALTPQYVRLIECGDARPSPAAVLRIADEFPDVDPASWLWELLTDLWGTAAVQDMRRHAVESTAVGGSGEGL